MKTYFVAALVLLHPGLYAQVNADAESLRISKTRIELEAAFSREDTACYAKFFVNDCLGSVNLKRREALSDLRQQEIEVEDMRRKAKGSAQTQKTEEKAGLENQPLQVEKRAAGLREYDARIANEKLKTANPSAVAAKEKASLDAAVTRAAINQKKTTERSSRQLASDEELRRYNAKVEKARVRQDQYAADKAKRANSIAKPLPIAD